MVPRLAASGFPPRPAGSWLSALWAPEFAGFYGLMDANASNPFGDWTFLWIPYCDGAVVLWLWIAP